MNHTSEKHRKGHVWCDHKFPPMKAKYLQPIQIACSGVSRISQSRGSQQQRWCHQSIILVNFPQKMQQNEKNWTQAGRTPLALLLRYFDQIKLDY